MNNNIHRIGEDLFSLVDEVAPPPGAGIILNFQNVEYFSAACLGKLITANKKLNNKGGKLVFSNMDDEIYETFEITELNKLFNIQKNVDAALKSIGFVPEKSGAESEKPGAKIDDTKVEFKEAAYQL